MKNLFRWLLWAGLLLAVGGGSSGFAQGTRADYERALSLGKRTEGKVFKGSVAPHWLAGNEAFWYRNDLVGGLREFVLVDAVKGERRAAFEHARVAAALVKASGREVRAERLPFDEIEFTGGREAVEFRAFGKRWRCVLASYEVTEIVAAKAGAVVPVTPQPAGAKARASGPSQEETSLTFVNQTAEEVALFWIDSAGKRRGYGSIKAGERHAQHTFVGHVWAVETRAGKSLGVFEARAGGGEAVVTVAMTTGVAEVARKAPAKSRGADESPDGKWRAFVRDHNVFVRVAETKEEFALTTDGTAEDAYEARFHWSPDARRLAVRQIRKGEERKVHLIESSPKDQVQPKLHELNYAKPGDRVALARPRLFDVGNRKGLPIAEALFPNPYELSELRWSPDSRWFAFDYNQRGHQVFRIVAVDADSGATRAVVNEECETFFCHSSKRFTHWLEASGELIWMSERDGWNHLYLYDTATGRVKNQITRGEWVVRGVERVDVERRRIWFRAGGVRAGQDPYQVHLCRVNFDGSGLVILTEGDGTHDWQFSPDNRLVIDRWSRVDFAPVMELRDAETGRLVCDLERAEAGELLKTGWRLPERFVAKGRDGVTDIFGIIIRPANFEAGKKYPVIEEIYAGPHSAFVPKNFGVQLRQSGMAELGFIVVRVDGMGTNWRSKKFHDVCWKNLGDSGFPDRIAWLKAAAARYPELDLSRVGIYGGSAGGQSTARALFAHGDFYKAGVADCGCHDNRMDKIWWNEQWMGWPVGPQYAEQSNVTHARNLQGKLLLIVGELDKNVDPASTMQVVNALIKADKDFELLVVPGAGHGIAESAYGSRRRMDFFVRNLLGVEPRGRP